MSAHRVRVTFTGFEPFWMRVLSEGLTRRFSAEFDCRWIVWPSTFLQRVRFVVAMLRSDVVVRVGMPFEFQSETNRLWLSWLRRSPTTIGMNYWIGSDALNVLSRAHREGLTELDKEALKLLEHIADSDSVRDELRSIDLDPTVAWLPAPNVPEKPVLLPLPATFTVLAYVPDRNPEFYGGPEVLAMAHRLPDVEFRVVGGEGGWLDTVPANLQFLGWQECMAAVFEEVSCLVRMVEHDSVSCMVMESLAYGRPVIYSRPLPHTIFVEFGDLDALERSLRDMVGDYRGAATRLDEEAADWATSVGNADVGFSAIARLIRTAASRTHRTPDKTAR